MEYLIQHRIKTLAQLFEPFEDKGFRFEQWNFTIQEGPTGDAWIASKTVQAEGAAAAINKFMEDLLPIVDRVAFVSQCFALVETESFMIERQERSGGVFYFRHAREVPPVPLHFDEHSVKSLRSLESFDEKGDVFRMLREAANASTFYTRFAMLTSTLEAIAGQRTVGRKIETDKEAIKQILQDDKLYEDLFGYGSGVRNQLLHGTKVTLTPGRPYVEDIYRAIVRFFNTQGAGLNERVVDPMRHFFNNYEERRGWLKMKQAHAPALKKLVEDFNADIYWEVAEEPQGY